MSWLIRYCKSNLYLHHPFPGQYTGDGWSDRCWQQCGERVRWCASNICYWQSQSALMNRSLAPHQPPERMLILDTSLRFCDQHFAKICMLCSVCWFSSEKPPFYFERELVQKKKKKDEKTKTIPKNLQRVLAWANSPHPLSTCMHTLCQHILKTQYGDRLRYSFW